MLHPLGKLPRTRGEEERPISAIMELSKEDTLQEQEYIEYEVCYGKLQDDMGIFSKDMRWAI